MYSKQHDVAYYSVWYPLNFVVALCLHVIALVLALVVVFARLLLRALPLQALPSQALRLHALLFRAEA